MIEELTRAYEEIKKDNLEQGGLDSNELIMVQNSLFYEWQHQHINTAELIKRAMKLNVQVFQFVETRSMFSLLEVDHFAAWCYAKYDNKADLAIFAFINVAVEVIKQFHPHNELFHLENARFILLDFEESKLVEHTEKMKEVQRVLNHYLKLESSLITGYPFTTLDNLFEMIRASSKDMNQLFYSPPACLLTQNDCESINKEIDLYSFFSKHGNGER